MIVVAFCLEDLYFQAVEIWIQIIKKAMMKDWSIPIKLQIICKLLYKVDLKYFCKNQEKMQTKIGLHNNQVSDQIKKQAMNQEYFLEIKVKNI